MNLLKRQAKCSIWFNLLLKARGTRLELALKLARARLAPFEQKYSVTSKYFISEMAAEDLEGGDEEYVCWAGEYRLMQRLQGKTPC